MDCSKKFGNEGCSGGLMDNGFKYEEQAPVCTEDRGLPDFVRYISYYGFLGGCLTGRVFEAHAVMAVMA